jgi:adenylate kinase
MEQKINTISTWLGTGSINIFGLPFAGKDTQGLALADLFGGVLMSGGDILRHNKDNAELQRIMAAGEIIPSTLWEEIVVPYLGKDEFKNKPLVLSEVGRLEGEQLVIEQATIATGHPQKAVILLSLSDEEVWNRFDASQKEHDRGERADDNREVLQTRLDSYHQKVMPVIDYYRNKGLLIEIDGSMSREEVKNAILDELLSKSQIS